MREEDEVVGSSSELDNVGNDAVEFDTEDVIDSTVVGSDETELRANVLLDLIPF